MRGAAMATNTKRTTKPFFFSEKLKILNKATDDSPRAAIAEEFGISASTLCKILQNGNKIREECRDQDVFEKVVALEKKC